MNRARVVRLFILDADLMGHGWNGLNMPENSIHCNSLKFFKY